MNDTIIFVSPFALLSVIDDVVRGALELGVVRARDRQEDHRHVVVDAEGIIAELIDEREGSGGTPEEDAMSAEQVREIVEGEVSTFGKAFKSMSGIVEAIAKQNDQLSNELAELKAEFAAYKNAPSNEVKEAEKFAKKSNAGMTSRQLFLLNNMKK